MRKPEAIVAQVRTLLHGGGSAEHAAGVQWFFKEPVRSHGWYTGDLRRLAAKLRREILAEGGTKLLFDVADQLFGGKHLEERSLAVVLLQQDVGKFGDKEFKRLERWLARVISWADHDALVHYLIGPMLVADSYRVRRIYRWANSRNRWFRRASAVALIAGVRKQLFFQDVEDLWVSLENETDDMVLKGIGWLLREAAKHQPRRTVRFLMEIRDHAPRLVLRTACETLPAATRARILGTATRARRRFQ
jgi:3-methyladenine DNA glycosylase AlkD